MLRLFISLLTVLLIVAPPAAYADRGYVWLPKDGEELSFKVFRNGAPFGYHNVSFEVDGEKISVRNEILLKAGVGPVNLFLYRHNSDEEWTDGQLVSLEGKTKKNGKWVNVDVVRRANLLAVDGDGFEGDIPTTIIPSSHWNIREVQSDQILSSENGEILDIEVEDLGPDQIDIGGAQVRANRYRLNSRLSVDLWYDEDGRWVKCQFTARGQTIEYVLEG